MKGQSRGKGQPGKAAAKGRGKRLLSSERILALAGFAAAAGAAFLPWYAMTGGHGLGIRNNGQLRLSGHRDDMAGYGIGGSIRPFGRKPEDLAVSKDRPDSLETGSLGGIRKPFDRTLRGGRPSQPFPGRPFRLVHVVNGQALISDGDGMYLVRVGSELPDRSRLKGFRKVGGRWKILTSEGDIVGD